MKFNCDRIAETYKERDKRQREWHEWFAWRPVRVASGDCRWLEMVERKIEREYYASITGDFCDTNRFYRAKENA